MGFIEKIRRGKVEETMNALRNGWSPEEVIEAMSRSLIKKVMHNYLENIRRLVEEGNEEMAR